MRVRHLTTLTRKDAAPLGVSGKLRSWGIDAGSPLPEWADAACQAWGFFGVASRHGDEFDGIILVAPESCLPDEHRCRKSPAHPGAQSWWASCPIEATFLGGECALRSWLHAYTVRFR